VLALNHFGAQETLVPVVFATWFVITASVLAEFWAKKA
jgi:predicted Na+-dependent transporter